MNRYCDHFDAIFDDSSDFFTGFAEGADVTAAEIVRALGYTPADVQTVEALRAAVATKADKTEVEALAAIVDTKADKTALDETSRSLDALWKLTEGQIWEWQTVSAQARSVIAPSGAQDGILLELGGMSRKGRNLFDPTNVVNRTNNGLTTTVNADGSISISGTPTSGSRYIKSDNNTFLVLEAGTYVASTGSDVVKGLNFEAHYNGGSRFNGVFTRSVTFTDTVYIETLYFTGLPIGTAINETLHVQIEKGTATEYEPYTADLISAPVDSWTASKDGESTTTTLPQAVIDLCPDYGMGVSADCYNYIDFAAKTYHRRVKKISVTSSTQLSGTANRVYFAAHDLIKKSDYRKSILCNALPTASSNHDDSVPAITGYRDDTTQYSNQNWFYIVMLGSPTDVTAWLAQNPLEVAYELAQEQTVDLSAVLDDETARLAVEAGGSVTFHYPLENSYDVDVPNTIKYLVKLSEVQ